MAYQTGIVNSLAGIQTVTRVFLTDNGWTWDAGSSTIYKDDMFVTFVTPSGDKVLFQAKTALSGGLLTENTVGMGRMVPAREGNLPVPITYPADYWAFLNDDEFYFVIRYDVARFQFVTWGKSTLDVGVGGVGTYLSGTVTGADLHNATGLSAGIVITPSTGGRPTGSLYTARCAAPFWMSFQRNTTSLSSDLTVDYVHTDFGAPSWDLWVPSGSSRESVGNKYAGPLQSVLPNQWNVESPLLPIRAYKRLAESKIALVLDLQHARQCRVDNFNDAEIISIGSDQWQVFPFHRKEIAARNGGDTDYIDHTGTFGWAIRKVD